MENQHVHSIDIFGYLNRTDISDLSSVKEINYIKIINLIHAQRGISRADVARKLNLSRTTVSAVVNGLIRKNIVREIGPGKSFGGRKPVLLELNNKIKVSIGIEIGDRECMGVLTDLYAHPIQDPVVNAVGGVTADGRWRGEAAVLKTIAELAKDTDPSSVLGVCLGIPGIYDEAHETITVAESLGLDHFSVRHLEKRIAYPLRVINRANAAALGERWYGLGRRFESMMYLYIADGIGSGIILNGELLKGSTGSAGEIGHTTILPNGPVCRCGSQGCLESLVSIPTVLSLAREFVKKDQRCALRDLIQNDLERVTLQSILEAANSGDAGCHKLLRQQAEYIGIAVANAVNMLDVQLVIVGGEMGCLLGDYFLPTIREVVKQRAQYFPEVQVMVSSLGMLAAPVGASAFLIGSRRE